MHTSFLIQNVHVYMSVAALSGGTGSKFKHNTGNT